jgi:hypothetical protein
MLLHGHRQRTPAYCSNPNERGRDRHRRALNFPALNHLRGEIILDPGMGAATTCAVAKRMNRRFIGIERFVKLAQSLTTKSKIAILVAWYAYTSL